MKNLSRLLLAPTLATVLLLACTATNAAHRGGESAYDGTWSVAINTLAGTALPFVRRYGSSVAACIPRIKTINRVDLSALMA